MVMPFYLIFWVPGAIKLHRKIHNISNWEYSREAEKTIEMSIEKTVKKTIGRTVKKTIGKTVKKTIEKTIEMRPKQQTVFQKNIHPWFQVLDLGRARQHEERTWTCRSSWQSRPLLAPPSQRRWLSCCQSATYCFATPPQWRASCARK